MSRLRQLISEVHRRSLWQVLLVYAGASYAVLEAVGLFIEQLGLPDWVFRAALVLLLIGLPVILLTAIVQAGGPIRTRQDPTLLPGDEGGAEASSSARLRGLFTWRNAALSGLFAFALLGIGTAGYMVMRVMGIGPAGSLLAKGVLAERERIVLAEFENHTNDSTLALTVTEAFRIDLSQSRSLWLAEPQYVRRVLARMEKEANTPLDYDLAREVAIREGLKAVIAGEVNTVGTGYLLSAWLVAVPKGEVLWTDREQAPDADAVIPAIDRLSKRLRGRIGESLTTVRNSKPLPDVTTRSLEALRKYAQAGEASRRGRRDQALALALEAIHLDSTFAVAYGHAGIQYYSSRGQLSEAARYTTRAYELRERMTDYRRLGIEAFYYFFVELDPRRAAAAWELQLSLYPDRGSVNSLGVMAGDWLGEDERAYQAYRRAIEMNPDAPSGWINAIEEARWTGRWDVADSLTRALEDHGFEDLAPRWHLLQAIGLQDWSRADALCDSLLGGVSTPPQVLGECRYLDLARGRIDRAIGDLETAVQSAAEDRRYLAFGGISSAVALAEQMRGRPEAARARLESMLARFPGDSIPEQDRIWARTRRRIVAAQLGFLDLVDRIEATYPAYPDTTHWYSRYGDGLADAARALARGEPERTIELLREITALGYEPRHWMFWVELLFGQAFHELAQVDSAVMHLEAAIEPARVAEYGFPRVYLPVVELRLAELEELRGDAEAAIQRYRRFIELWADADPELQPRVEAARRAIEALSPDT